jgi:hypothetical protein
LSFLRVKINRKKLNPTKTTSDHKALAHAKPRFLHSAKSSTQLVRITLLAKKEDAAPYL